MKPVFVSKARHDLLVVDDDAAADDFGHTFNELSWRLVVMEGESRNLKGRFETWNILEYSQALWCRSLSIWCFAMNRSGRHFLSGWGGPRCSPLEGEQRNSARKGWATFRKLVDGRSQSFVSDETCPCHIFGLPLRVVEAFPLWCSSWGVTDLTGNDWKGGRGCSQKKRSSRTWEKGLLCVLHVRQRGPSWLAQLAKNWRWNPFPILVVSGFVPCPKGAKHSVNSWNVVTTALEKPGWSPFGCIQAESKVLVIDKIQEEAEALEILHPTPVLVMGLTPNVSKLEIVWNYTKYQFNIV